MLEERKLGKYKWLRRERWTFYERKDKRQWWLVTESVRESLSFSLGPRVS